MPNFCNINDNMVCFQSRIWRGCWNSWIKGLVFIGDYRKAMKRKYRRENERNSKKEDKKAKVKKSNKSRLNSLLLLWNRFMQNTLLISTVTWPHPKGNKLFQVTDALEGSQMHWRLKKLVWNHWTHLLILTH